MAIHIVLKINSYLHFPNCQGDSVCVGGGGEGGRNREFPSAQLLDEIWILLN